jgi:hypothetical protein
VRRRTSPSATRSRSICTPADPDAGGASLLARNRDEDFPGWRKRDLATTRPELGFALLATHGATTASVLDVQLPRLASLGVVPRVVTLTVGRNDVLGAYVGTVYDPSDGISEAWRVGLPPWPDVADIVVELNYTLKAVAAKHDALVADIHERFLGHGLQAGNPAQPNPRPGDRALWYCNIIEPNAWGADAVRAALWVALQAHGEPRVT